MSISSAFRVGLSLARSGCVSSRSYSSSLCHSAGQPISLARRQLATRAAAMGAGSSKGEEGGRKKSSRKSRETAAVATHAQPEAAGQAKTAASQVEFVEATVAKASEFGENELVILAGTHSITHTHTHTE